MSEIMDSNKDETASSTTEAAPEVTQFNWDEYMKEFGFEAAPDECFFQTPEPPKNKFEIGRKLIVPDPRGGNMDCLGSIQQSHAAWVHVRLEGTDNSDDRWVMCDDQGIKPIFRDDLSGVNPPVGYIHGLRGYHKWLEQQLSEVDGANTKADVEWFCPINDTYRPSKNLFKVGQKLESVDPRNFSGTPHVATITKVDKRSVTVHFDGWKSSYDIVEPFDSRNLFPVGWSKKAGLEVACPSLKLVKADAANLAKKKAEAGTPTSSKNKTPSRASPATVKSAPKPKAPVQRLSELGAKPTVLPSKRPPKIASSAAAAHAKPQVSHVSPPSTSGTEGTRKRDNEGTPEQPPKKKPMVAPPTATSTTKTDEKPELKKERSSPAPQAQGQPSMVKPSGPNVITGKAAIAPFTTQTAQLTTPGTPTDVMLSCGDSVPQSQRSMTVFINRSCKCGPLLNPAKIAELPRVIGPLSIHHVVREVIQQLINCGNEHQSVYRKVDAGPVKILSVTAQVNGFTNVRYIPIVKNVSAAWGYVRKLIFKIGCCPNLIADCASPCNICPGSPDDAEDGEVSTTQASGNRTSHSQIDGMSDASAETTGSISQQPIAQWGIDRVAEELSKTFEPAIVDKFTQNQIDGRALLLLSTDLLMKHLGMPLGPAIKVVDLVNALKEQYRRKQHAGSL